MAWIYQADVYCDTCGPLLCKSIVEAALRGPLDGTNKRAANGNPIRGPRLAPTVSVGEPDGETVTVMLEWPSPTDSGTFPVPGELDEDHEATDSPQHCASGDSCENAEDGHGAPIGTALTEDGRKWLVDHFTALRGSHDKRKLALAKSWHDRFNDDTGGNLPCYHCGRERVEVIVTQSRDAITEDGKYVAYGTPGSEPQCMVVTPCQSCAETDQTVDGSSWEDCDDHNSYTILSGEASDVVLRLTEDGYDAHEGD